MNIAVIVPTLNAGSAWQHWTAALLITGVDVSDIYIVDSGSSDGTVLQSEKAGFNVKKIQPGTFNHGGTRQLAVASLAGYDVAVFLTQDAILRDGNSLKSILEPFQNDEVAAVCGNRGPLVYGEIQGEG